MSFAVRFLLFIGQILGFTISTLVFAQDELATTIELLVDQAIDQGQLPGAVVMIGHGDDVVLNKAYGFCTMKPELIPMTVDTVFDLASLTKPIATATSVMILAQRGAVDLQEPVAKHLPAFANHGKELITFEQLLLHTGGLIPDNPMSDYDGTPKESIDRLMNLDLNYSPGTKFRYSDVGFQILGEWVRVKTGRGIDVFSHDEIFGPLGMKETMFTPSESLRARSAPTEMRDGRWMLGDVHDPRAFALGGVAGHAGLFSTASDLAIYCRMMLGQGTLADRSVLDRVTWQRMTSGHEVPGGIRGLGWDKQSGFSSNRGKSMTDSAFGHGGFTGTALWIDPDLQLYVIFLSNRLHPSGQGSVNKLAGEIGNAAALWVQQQDSATQPAPGTTEPSNN